MQENSRYNANEAMVAMVPVLQGSRLIELHVTQDPRVLDPFPPGHGEYVHTQTSLGSSTKASCK